LVTGECEVAVCVHGDDGDIHSLTIQGSRPRCFCRFFFCTVLITLFLIIGVILSLALVRRHGRASQSHAETHFQWIRPPNIIIGSVDGSVRWRRSIGRPETNTRLSQALSSCTRCHYLEQWDPSKLGPSRRVGSESSRMGIAPFMPLISESLTQIISPQNLLV
jgi:hypothetical protein